MKKAVFFLVLICVVAVSMKGLDQYGNHGQTDIKDLLDHITIDLPGLPDNIKPLEMVLVRPGLFIMGSDKKQLGRFGSPWPKHEVTITEPFYIGKMEITQAQYEALRGKRANHSKHKGQDLSVEKPSWYDTQLFLKKLNKLEQGHFRLPTEAEWEYACQLSDSLGILGMKSGLCEWCEDKYRKSYERDPRTDPRYKGGWFSLIWPLTNRVFKGESAGIDPEEIAAFRGYEQAIDYHYTIGFRIVMQIN